MELFDKIYNCYFQIVAQIINQSQQHPISRQQMQTICDKYGFLESGMTIIPKLTDGCWGFLEVIQQDSFISKLSMNHHYPLTTLQKSWIKALVADERFSLFFTDHQLKQIANSFVDIEPLYQHTDFYYIDQFQDGDPFSDPLYRTHFQHLLNAVKSCRSLVLSYQSPKRRCTELEFLPCRIQYSEKDNKFRIIGATIINDQIHKAITINISRIKQLTIGNYVNQSFSIDSLLAGQLVTDPVIIEISGQRNSLERCMLQFSNYIKQTCYDEEKEKYICSIYYNLADETELLIQILSFGPTIKVLEPERFLKQVKKRIKHQYALFHA